MKEDSKLRQVLLTWEVTPLPAADFNQAVWRRIEAGPQPVGGRVWATLREWLVVQLPRPAYASVLLLLTAAFGAAAANVRAEHYREQVRLENARQYLASIDPIAMNAHSLSAPR